MEKFQEYRQKARQHLKNADYLVTMTYPMVGDSKLLLAAAENLADALNLSILSVLAYEQLYRRIPPFQEDPESALNTFTRDVVPRYRMEMSETARGAHQGASKQGKAAVLGQAQNPTRGYSPEVFDKNYIKLVTDLNELVKLHRDSSVEFTRKDRFVIASGTYKLMEISPGYIKDNLERAKRFMEIMEIIVSKDEPLPRRRV